MSSDSKKATRRTLIEERDALSFDNWDKDSQKIQSTVLRSNIYKEADILFLYSDFHGEVGTLTLIEEALLNGKKVYLPKVMDGYNVKSMEFFRINSTYELVEGYKTIKEPIFDLSRKFSYEENKDKKLLMLVPGVAFNKEGYRLGYGMGYYDKYLENKDNVLKFGLCFSMQISDTFDIEEYDVKMDFLVTEKTTLDEINEMKFM